MATVQSAPALSPSGNNPAPLLRVILESLGLHQCVFAAAELGLADLLVGGPKSVTDLAAQAKADEDSLYRVLRLLASEGVFAEIAPRIFAIWQITRLSSSSPVTATTASARSAPASSIMRTSHPSPCIATSPSSSAMVR